MSRTFAALCFSLAVANQSSAGDAKPLVVEFGKSELGKPPAGWTITRTGEGKGSEWQVIADASAPSKAGRVLAQTAESPRAMFNLCVLDQPSLLHVRVSVSLKATKGEVDQGGGLLWRYQDAKNYYIARFNPLEENFRLYKVIDGKRIQLAGKEGVKGETGQWHRLSCTMKGHEITCTLNDAVTLKATDDAIKGPGKVGLWTKADAQTRFDGFEVMDLGK